MYYKLISGMEDAAAWGAGQTLCAHSPRGSTFMREMTVILKLWRHITNPMPSTEEQSYQISPQVDLKRRSRMLFEEIAPTKKIRTWRTWWVVIWNQFLM